MSHNYNHFNKTKICQRLKKTKWIKWNYSSIYPQVGVQDADISIWTAMHYMAQGMGTQKIFLCWEPG